MAWEADSTLCPIFRSITASTQTHIDMMTRAIPMNTLFMGAGDGKIQELAQTLNYNFSRFLYQIII